MNGRRECAWHILESDEWVPCNKPAVDFIMSPGHRLADAEGRMWYCAEHWDRAYTHPSPAATGFSV
jgi:hypothetical protein